MDGRAWVTSEMNWGEMYNKGLLRRFFGHTWLTAKDFRDDQYGNQWQGMSRFEKLCWAWACLNQTSLSLMAKNPNAKVYKFENVFHGENRYQYLEKMIKFLLVHPGINLSGIKPTHGWLNTRVHKSSGSFPSWQNWPEEKQKIFDGFCHPLMEEMGYYE